jgi:hypothetical protein
MNKNEQNRVVAWRLKLLRQASDMPRSVAQTCRHILPACHQSPETLQSRKW